MAAEKGNMGTIPIGGFLELELPKGVTYHPNALALNSGRSAFEYLIRTYKYEKIFVPSFTCSAIFETVKKTGVDIQTYSINDSLEPIFDFATLKTHQAFLYTNYFGIKSNFVRQLINLNGKIIIDNCQSFFDKPLDGTVSFYSPRKFFGVPDGGYAYNLRSVGSITDLPPSVSSHCISHLVMRHDGLIEAAYELYKKNENFLAKEPMRRMSTLTGRILSSIDYEKVKEIRQANFALLHSFLAGHNMLPIDEDPKRVALTYPLLCKSSAMRERLHNSGIYTPTYWPNVLESAEPVSLEAEYSERLVHLPIDQRYGDKEMKRVLKVILG